MNACAATSLISVVAALSAVGTAACGGGASTGPSAVAPNGAEGPASPEPQSAAPADPPPTGSAASASEAPADLAAGDTRTGDSIMALVKAHRKEARDCYEKAMKQIPGLKGDVVIRFTLKPSGAVKQAELNEERSTIREASVSSCVIDVIRAITFPRSSKGLETTVNYPFNFNP